MLRTEAMLALGLYESSFVDKALEILRTTGSLKELSLAKYFKGRIQFALGELLDAQESLIETYAYTKRLGDSPGIARTTNLLSGIAYQRADYELFQRYSQIALKAYEEIGDNKYPVIVNFNLALCDIRQGRLKSAKQRLFSLKCHVESLKDSHKYNFFHLNALVSCLLNEFKNSEEFLRLVQELPEDLIRERCRHYEISGYVYMLQGDYAKAKKLLLQGIELANTMVEPVKALYSQIYRLLGDVHILTKEWKTAEKYANDALKVAVEINERLEIAACYRILAQVHNHSKDSDAAREYYKKSIDLFNLIDARYELAVTRYLAASSGLYNDGERQALLYLAREYFVSEDVNHYVEKVDKELQKLSTPVHKVVPSANGAPVIVAASPKMKKIVALAEQVAASEMTVLLTGATGTGKDLLARHIHHYSGRTGEFVSINSAAIPHDMIESELFGYKRGAFTGAVEDRPGLFEQAENGTFYLNEIADATLAFQAKLLVVLETRQIRRLGENKMRPVSFRLIAATNHDLLERIRENKFRADLYHRLKQIPLHLPSLSERPEDIELLTGHFLKSLGCIESTAEIGKALAECSWPGNVRELEAEIRQLWLVAKGSIAKMSELLSSNGDESERDRLVEALNATDWNRRETARKLNMNEATVRYRIKKFGILEPELNQPF